MSNKTHLLEIEDVNSFFGKSMGMLGKKDPKAIFFKTRFGIHTFGLHFPIDVLILNNENCVVKIREHLQPNRLFFWNPKYHRVIELPSGAIYKNTIEINNKIQM